MSLTIPVPSRLQQPLHVDTDMNYDLDMSKFPGLDDPQHMYQPALLIATSQDDMNVTDSVEHCKETRTIHCLNSSHRVPATRQCSEPSTRDVLEELLNVIDSCSSELLDRLVDTSIQDQVTLSGDNMYKSVMDACVYKPQIRTVPRNNHIVTRTNHIVTRTNHIVTRTNNVNHPTSDRSTMMNYYNGLHYNTHECDTIMDLPKWNKSSHNVFQGVHPRYEAPSYSVSSKRKRSLELSDFAALKRQCHRPNTISYYGYGHGFNNQYPTFHESVYNRGLVV